MPKPPQAGGGGRRVAFWAAQLSSPARINKLLSGRLAVRPVYTDEPHLQLVLRGERSRLLFRHYLEVRSVRHAEGVLRHRAISKHG